MIGSTTIGSTPIAMVSRRVVIAAGCFRLSIDQVASGAAVASRRDLPSFQHRTEASPQAVAASAELLGVVREVLAANLGTDATAAGDLVPGAIAAEPLLEVGRLAGSRVVPTTAIGAELQPAAGDLVPSATMRQGLLELKACELTTDATAGASIDLVALRLQSFDLVGLVIGSRTIPAIANHADLEKKPGDLVPSAELLGGVVEVLAGNLGTDATAAGNLVPGAIAAEPLLEVGRLAGSRVVPAAAIGAELQPTSGDLVPSATMRQGLLELQACELTTDATAGASIDLVALRLQAVDLVGLVIGSRTIPTIASHADLEMKPESLAASAELLGDVVEVLARNSGANATAAADLVPGAIAAATTASTNQAEGANAIAAGVSRLQAQPENSTSKPEGVLHGFRFTLSGTPGEALPAAAGNLVPGAIAAESLLEVGRLAGSRVVPAAAIGAELQPTSGDLVPSATMRQGLLELQAFELTTDATIGASIDLVALRLQAIDLVGLVAGSLTIPTASIEATPRLVPFKGAGPVLISPPELIFRLGDAWPYYSLADCRLAYRLDDDRLAFELVDNRLGYDLGPGWMQCDLRDNSFRFQIEE
ncbi:hypothetical protein AB1L30_01220 [Bremerella sp. JC817]|uniref:hypothetical protein n=1 Tax=Bremerella sp. JC817 TaxID=3231756 RepID=UPI0034591CD6